MNEWNLKRGGITVIPAIDLKGGKCVRLRQGVAADATVYGDDPVAMALRWQGEGGRALHVVDLDGAFAGHPVHAAQIGAIAKALDIPVEAGGGLRTDADARMLLDAGVARVVIGTRAISDAASLERLVADFGPGRIAVGIDARGGYAQANGWVETSSAQATDLARRVAGCGVRSIIYTDTATDGMLSGPNLAALAEIADAVPECDIVASGGISSPADIAAIRALGRENIVGAIVGKALYDGRATLGALQKAGRKMRIAVCIKQVPGTSQVEIDEKTGTLKRDGVPAKMNPFDLYALETAMRIRAAAPGGADVAVLTMGPPQCEKVVREAFMMGADSGAILSDRAFGGADVLMTSFTLSKGIGRIGPFDLIVCGKQTTDGDTAQVGPELAEWLGIPHVAGVKSIDKVGADALELTVDEPGYTLSERIPYPFLMTVEKGIFEPRLPSYRLKCATAGREILWLGLKDLDDTDPKHYGLNGSPTQVKRIFPPENDVRRVTLEGDDKAKAAALAALLDERKFLR